MTNKEKKEVTKLISEIVWMARRYADGRRTFSATTFNDTYDKLRALLGDIDNGKDSDHVLMCDGRFYPYAQDGAYTDGGLFNAVGQRPYIKKV